MSWTPPTFIPPEVWQDAGGPALDALDLNTEETGLANFAVSVSQNLAAYLIARHDRWSSFVPFIGAPLSAYPSIASWVPSTSQDGSTSYILGLAYYNTNDAVGDSASWLVDITSGTWNLSVVGAQQPNGGQVSVDWGQGGDLPPSAPTLSAPAAGTLAAGVYSVIVTFTTAAGETLASPPSAITEDGAHNLVIASPSAPAGSDIQGWNAYVTAAGGSTYYRQQSAQIGSNITLSTSPVITGAQPPTTDTTLTWTTAGTMDQYSAVSSPYLWQFPNIAVPNNGKVRVRFRVTGKNASSSDYYALLSGMHWQRTA